MKDNRSVRWSDRPYELSIELDNIISTLNNYAYSLDDNKIATESVTSLLYCTCNHLERIKADLEALPEVEVEPKTMTETVTTTKTLYL